MKKTIKNIIVFITSVFTVSTFATGVFAEDSTPDEEKNYKIAFIGDSICQMGQWSSLFPNATIDNFGVGGENTNDILARFNQVYGDYDKLFIVCGANDWSLDGWGSTCSASMSNFENMFKLAKENMPDIHIYVSGILPTCKSYKHYINENLSPKYNANLKALAGKYGYVTFMDECWDALLDTTTGLGYEEYSRDGLHPTPEGFELLKDAMEPYVYGEIKEDFSDSSSEDSNDSSSEIIDDSSISDTDNSSETNDDSSDTDKLNSSDTDKSSSNTSGNNSSSNANKVNSTNNNSNTNSSASSSPNTGVAAGTSVALVLAAAAIVVLKKKK